MISVIKGVHWSPAQKKWYSRTPHKKVLYRGDRKEEAEKARIAYDEGKVRGRPLKAYKNKEKFRNVWQPCWPSSSYFES